MPKEENTAKQTILIIDDSPINVNILGTALSPYYSILVAFEGRRGLEIARHETCPPDLIILDIMMPGIDGYEVCRQLQADPRSKDIPVIFITSLAASENENKGLSLGAVDYISKPFNLAVVRARVATHLELKKQRDQLLAQQEELFRLNQDKQMILEGAGDGIYGIDKAGLISFINPAALKMIGRDENEVIGKNSCEIMHLSKTNGEQYPEAECMVKQSMIEGELKENNHEIFWRKDSTSFPVEYVAAPTMRDGALTGAVVVFKDITMRKQLETELLRADKLKAFGVLAGGIAHDFNNLLTAILGNLELAMMDVRPEGKMYKALENSYRSSLQARDLAAKFLTISQGDIAQQEEIYLDSIIHNVLHSMDPSSGIDFKINLPDHNWPIRASHLQIIQLLKNILLNSQEAMLSCGTITITLNNCPNGSKDQPSLTTDPYVKISVQDQGEGISAENYPKIFDPYFSTKPRGTQKGMGLGLTICLSIIQKHNGLLQIESLPGEGTTVNIYLPAAKTTDKQRTNNN